MKPKIAPAAPPIINIEKNELIISKFNWPKIRISNNTEDKTALNELIITDKNMISAISISFLSM